MGLRFSVSRLEGPIQIHDADGAEWMTIELIGCRVRDQRHSGVEAWFEYQLWRYEEGTKELGLRSVQVRPELQSNVMAYPPIAISMVRDLPLARWEAAARAFTSMLLDKAAEQSDPLEFGDEIRFGAVSTSERNDLAMELLAAKYPDVWEDSTPGGRRHAASLFKLAKAAVDYRIETGLGHGDPAIRIAKLHDVSPSTARSWIHRARKAGLLGPALDRQTGEAPDHVSAEAILLLRHGGEDGGKS